MDYAIHSGKSILREYALQSFKGKAKALLVKWGARGFRFGVAAFVLYATFCACDVIAQINHLV